MRGKKVKALRKDAKDLYEQFLAGDPKAATFKTFFRRFKRDAQKGLC